MIVTPNAKFRISMICDPAEWFRVSVKAGGCSGFEKQFSVVCQMDPDQDVRVGQVCMDKASAEILQNAVLDYRVDLSGSQFLLTVPEATSACGCGKSFSLF
jgi:iron-sulfur cluster assembly accessory protein